MKRYLAAAASLLHALAMIIVIARCENAHVATHFGASGAADGYGSKWTYLVIALLPLLFAAVGVLTDLLSKKAQGLKALNLAFGSCALFFIPLGWLLALPALNGAESLGPYLLPCMGMLIGMLIGALSAAMKNCAPNHIFGIRTASTLSDPEIWKKTHALAARTGAAGGAAMALCSALGLLIPALSVVLLLLGVAAALAGLFYPAAYAARLARERDNSRP